MMKHNINKQEFSNTLSTQVSSLITDDICKLYINRHTDTQGNIDTINSIIKECAELIFDGEIDIFLKHHFKGDYQIFWASYDRVDSYATDYSMNTRWHLDYGIKNSLKIFIYLNPVSEHGGNTLIYNQEKTEALRKAGALPMEHEKRYSDLPESLSQSCQPVAYDLKAGDALIFSPLLLAHKCQLPLAGKMRHTISYTITPPIGHSLYPP